MKSATRKKRGRKRKKKSEIRRMECKRKKSDQTEQIGKQRGK